MRICNNRKWSLLTRLLFSPETPEIDPNFCFKSSSLLEALDSFPSLPPIPNRYRQIGEIEFDERLSRTLTQSGILWEGLERVEVMNHVLEKNMALDKSFGKLRILADEVLDWLVALEIDPKNLSALDILIRFSKNVFLKKVSLNLQYKRFLFKFLKQRVSGFFKNKSNLFDKIEIKIIKGSNWRFTIK